MVDQFWGLGKALKIQLKKLVMKPTNETKIWIIVSLMLKNFKSSDSSHKSCFRCDIKKQKRTKIKLHTDNRSNIDQENKQTNRQKDRYIPRHSYIHFFPNL